jgi:hypothetical protein
MPAPKIEKVKVKSNRTGILLRLLRRQIFISLNIKTMLNSAVITIPKVNRYCVFVPNSPNSLTIFEAWS